ncbi:hypothetical protein J6590_045864 [Homalodisca vitripennis]|nr:hypothetical protein J6590_045864 [Homalodisca vitripennis]
MVKALTKQVAAQVKQLSSTSAPLASTSSIPVAPSKSASTYAVIATGSTKPKEADTNKKPTAASFFKQKNATDSKSNLTANERNPLSQKLRKTPRVDSPFLDVKVFAVMLSHVVTPVEGLRFSLNHPYALQNVLFKPILDYKCNYLHPFSSYYGICCVYFPPAPAEFDTEEFEDLLNSLPTPFMVVGDFNPLRSNDVLERHYIICS